MTKQQKTTLDRIKRIDPQAKTQEVEGQLFVTYVPGWEKGRHKAGTFVPNANPTPIRFFIDDAGLQYGWGFGNESKVPVKLAMPITTKADMEPVLKARLEARRPEPKPEVEEQPEPKATTRKPRTRKTSTRKTATPTA